MELSGMEGWDFGEVDHLSIYTLLDDYAGYETGFYGQHGISFLVDVVAGEVRRRILFDVGQSGEPILYNMEKMGLGPGEVNVVFLSHCHYDHTGGLLEILRAIGKEVPVIAHPRIFRKNLVRSGSRNVGLPYTKEEAEEYGARWILDSQPRELMEGVITTGEIPREERVDFERETTLGLYTIEAGKLVRDYMLDDISLAVRTREGLVVVSGCSHAGIVSIVERAKRITGSREVRAVVGGFHLIDADDRRIERTVEALREMRVGRIYTGHCTGLRAECRFLREFRERFEKLHSGRIIKL